MAHCSQQYRHHTPNQPADSGASAGNCWCRYSWFASPSFQLTRLLSSSVFFGLSNFIIYRLASFFCLKVIHITNIYCILFFVVALLLFKFIFLCKRRILCPFKDSLILWLLLSHEKFQRNHGKNLVLLTIHLLHFAFFFCKLMSVEYILSRFSTNHIFPVNRNFRPYWMVG